MGIDEWMRWWVETRTLTGRLMADEDGMSTVEYSINLN
ncbi:DUF4244 domain-containing protein [Gordonia humi]|uniref:Uncharacterized protein n=1 Tax=Gordonia humi TaxID=686429 RepID=A0A840EYB8_9ACTN|nr:DUF4244 domain-containing protein [Gordonia humi]MBB4134776.1 hypothetical protein [Gordonia humi]